MGFHNRSLAYPKLVMFDVDETLIDHRNTDKRALEGVMSKIEEFSGLGELELRDRFARDFRMQWKDVIFGKTTLEAIRVHQFERILKELGNATAHELALRAAEIYGDIYDSNTTAIPGTQAILKRIREMGIPIALVTNNLVNYQKLKLKKAGFANLYDFMLTSEETRCFKPDSEMFTEVLDQFDCSPKEALMVGDSFPEDIVGASNVGVKPVWFNRHGLTPPDSEFTFLEIKDFQPVENTFNTLISWF